MRGSRFGLFGMGGGGGAEVTGDAGVRDYEPGIIMEGRGGSLFVRSGLCYGVSQEGGKEGGDRPVANHGLSPVVESCDRMSRSRRAPNLTSLGG